MSAQCKIQVRFCGAGAGMGAVLGTGAGMVRVRVRFAGAGAILVRVKIFAHFGQCFNYQKKSKSMTGINYSIPPLHISLTLDIY